ncbi:uncharacterized protein LOC123302399 isoform X1 [Chrysoperla carnea]|uniref:uncharacterized protein LOC123302399 isoform X1 n=1 Tax=Chrysoperla carnea TaxID=189513 RepID=UPI001D06AE48|nr:uncharacterized protein LOC123302399 isoform X1 [Chrysoperla carnea]
MAFKQVCTSLLVTVACCSVLSVATPLSYLRDNDQNVSPFQNQNQGFVYLRDNGVNQPAVYPVQSGPVNVVNNLGNSQILGSSQIQTISSYPGVIGNVGLVGNNGFGSNIINNVNNVNGLNGLSTIQYPTFAQAPLVSYPSVQQVLPVAQYAVQQPAYIGGPVGYSNNNNQITNNQVAPVEVNFSGSQGYLGSPIIF